MGPTDYRLGELAAEAKVRPSHIHHFIHWLAAGNPPEMFAAFAKLEQRHTDQMLAALQAHDLMPKRRQSSRGSTAVQGTRLPAVFQAPQEWIDYAQTKRKWPLDDVHEELDKFTDYWHGRPGAGGVKADWLATWRNWCRNSTRPDGNWTAAPKMTASEWNAYCEQTALWWEARHNEGEAARWRGKVR